MNAIRFEDLAAHKTAPIVFLHIPRTGGSSFKTMLKRNCNQWFPMVEGWPAELFVTPLVWRRFFTDDAGDLPPFGRQRFVLSGHMTMADPVFAAFRKPFIVMTLLRDPVARMVSHYQFHAGLDDRRGATNAFTQAIRDGSDMMDYCARFAGTLIPHQFQHFAQGPREAAEILNRHVAIFGFTDRMEDLLPCLRKELGFRYADQIERQKESRTVAPTDIDREALGRLLAADGDFIRRAEEIRLRRECATPTTCCSPS